MSETGKIINITPTQATIQKSDTTSCNACNIKSICNYKNQKEFTIENTDNLQVGDTVELIITPNQRLFSSFVAYILPLIIFFILYLVFSEALKLNELFSIMFSLLWIPFWVISLRFINKNSKNLQIKVKKLGETNENTLE